MPDARYVYALVPAGTELPAGLVGLGDQPVDRVDVGPLAAVCSGHDGARIVPRRTNVAAHQAVLAALAPTGAVLPMNFGTVADDAATLAAMLDQDRDAFLDAMGRVTGCVEMGLRLAWDVENVFGHLLARHPEIARLREQLQSNGGGTRDEQARLARLFDEALQAEREQHERLVRDALGSVARELEIRPPREEHQIVDFAALVPVDQVDAFEAAVHAAAEQFDDAYVFDLNGPWAPHNFARTNFARTNLAA